PQPPLWVPAGLADLQGGAVPEGVDQRAALEALGVVEQVEVEAAQADGHGGGGGRLGGHQKGISCESGGAVASSSANRCGWVGAGVSPSASTLLTAQAAHSRACVGVRYSLGRRAPAAGGWASSRPSAREGIDHETLPAYRSLSACQR